MYSPFILILLSLLAITNAATNVATVDFSKNTGPAKFLASGFIYGWPDNGVNADSSIPENLVKDIRFNFDRAGGAQISARGWAYGGKASYVGRFNSTLSNYRTTRKYGGTFILLVHDLWGADGGGSPPLPGDKGSFNEATKFLTQLVADIKANNMLDGLVLDLWNEPGLTIFWPGTWDQYLKYWVFAYKFFRNALPNTTISGPSEAYSPITTSTK